jgi:hypothetical protein
VIYTKSDGGTARRGDHLGGLVNRFRAIVWGAAASHASSRAVDRRAGFSESPRDATTCAACRSGNYDDGPGK